MVKNPPAIQEMWVKFQVQEHPLEKEMAAHSNILAWEIPQREEPGGIQSMGLQRVRRDLQTEHIHIQLLQKDKFPDSRK